MARTHDFPGDSTGKAVPCGVCDLTANAGWVPAGTDHDTAAFAVESVRRWWKAAGRGDHPLARRLLITADAGGSNGYRTRAWKAELAALAAETGLEITCHFPPGISKWNKIEHRLFSHITMNWRGRPLTSHDWHGDWNCTLRPEPYDQDGGAPDPFDRPSPDLAWLCHPALTGLTAQEWDALTTALMTLHDQQRETSLAKRRGHRPRLAVTLHQRLAVPQVAIAVLFSVRPETINMRIRDTRQLLDQAGHAIQPSPHRLAALDDLYSLATAAGIAVPPQIKTAC